MPSILEVDTIKNKTGTQNTVLSTDGSGNNTISVANIKANDGTAGISIADSTGQLTFTKPPADTIVGYKQHVLTTRHDIPNTPNTGSNYDDLGGWTWTKLELSHTLKTASPIIHLSCHLCMSTTNHVERLSIKVHRVDSSGNSVSPVSGFVASQESSRRHCHTSDLYFTHGSDEHMMNFAFNTQDDLSLSAGTTVYYRVYANQNSSGITLYINRAHNDTNHYYIPSSVSSLTLMEVAE